MRKAAGILIIIGGLIGGTLFTAVLNDLGVHGVLTFVPMLLAAIGGVMALRRVHWGWAIAGAVCSVFMIIWLAVVVHPLSLIHSLWGILAVVFLIKRKYEFD